jgi:hypothetical protein
MAKAKNRSDELTTSLLVGGQALDRSDLSSIPTRQPLHPCQTIYYSRDGAGGRYQRQSADYTALAVIQGVSEGPASEAGPHKALHLGHLERYPLRTPYPEIADKVAALMGDPALSPEERVGFRLLRTPPRLIMDATGIGTAVSDFLATRPTASRSGAGGCQSATS